MKKFKLAGIVIVSLMVLLFLVVTWPWKSAINEGVEEELDKKLIIGTSLEKVEIYFEEIPRSSHTLVRLECENSMIENCKPNTYRGYFEYGKSDLFCSHSANMYSIVFDSSDSLLSFSKKKRHTCI